MAAAAALDGVAGEMTEASGASLCSDELVVWTPHPLFSLRQTQMCCSLLMS